MQGKPKIVINLSTQRLQYYKGGELVGVSPISSGRESNGTVTGTYRIIEKDMDHRSSLFGAYADMEGNLVQEDVDTRTDALPKGAKFIGASMRYFMRIVGGIGMHEGYLPGYPASHGCIRLPTKMAAIFFRETPHGTPVEIIGQGSLAANEEAIPIGSDEIEITTPPAASRSDIAASAPVARHIAAVPPASKAPPAASSTPPPASKAPPPASSKPPPASSKPLPARASFFASFKPKKTVEQPRQAETVRRAIVPMKKRIARLKPGETLYVEP